MDNITFDWNKEKNHLLKKERDISFEDVVLALQNNKLLDIISSPTHKNQECLVVNIREYAYIIPFVMDDEVIFLKTIYPSRKHTKFYLKG